MRAGLADFRAMRRLDGAPETWQVVAVFDEDATSLEADSTTPELARPRLGDRASGAAAPRPGDPAEEAPTKPLATLGVTREPDRSGASGSSGESRSSSESGRAGPSGISRESRASSEPMGVSIDPSTRTFDRVRAALAPKLERGRGLVRERALTATFVASVVGLVLGLWFGSGDDVRDSGDVFSTRIGGVPVVRARVERVEGAIDVRPGDECVIGVWRVRTDHPTGGSWCRTQLACGGELLYGGDESGYFECENEGIGRDTKTTELDGDPSLDLRVPDGALVIADDVHGARGAFRVEASIETAHAVGAR